MGTISVIIVEDEFHESELLKTFLIEIGGISILKIANDELSALTSILEHKPDLVFFDINLNGKPAFDILKTLKNTKTKSQIIFTTAFEEYALKVFEYSTMPFLLKPIDKKKLSEIIEKFREKKINQQLLNNIDLFDQIKFKDGNNSIFFKPLDIFYCKSNGRYTKIYTNKTKYSLVTTSLKEIEEMLSKYNFKRIHRSCIINMAYLKKFDSKNNNCFIDKDNEKVVLEVSRKNRIIF